jgi:polyphenol oxidase
MEEKTVHGLKLLSFATLNRYTGLFHAVSTRIGGVSPAPFHSLNLGIHTEDEVHNISANYDILCSSLQIDLRSIVTSHQVHETKIARVDKVPAGTIPFPFEHALTGYDAFITDKPGITLMVRIADCVPLIIYDPLKHALAVVHAGWKGTLAGITEKTVAALVQDYGCSPVNIKAGIGPSIGPCCFSVQKNVENLFHMRFSNARQFIHDASDGPHIDLQQANRLQLIAAGCLHDNIEMSGVCTACNLNLFFSHRGEKGKTGRLGLLAGLRP